MKRDKNRATHRGRSRHQLGNGRTDTTRVPDVVPEMVMSYTDKARNDTKADRIKP